MPDLTPEKLAELRRLAEAATPGPWFWWGNTDNHSVALCGHQPGLGVCEVISTLSVDRSTTGREADQLRRNLAEYTGMSLGDIEEAVEEWATDEYGQPRTDQRLSITDENYIRRTAEELAVYEVARAQGLPDDTPRDHERIYRADVCDLRAANARYLAGANPSVVLALLDAAAERDALLAAVNAHVELNTRRDTEWDAAAGRLNDAEVQTALMSAALDQACEERDALLAERDALAAKLDAAIDVAHLDRQRVWSAGTFGPAEVRGHRGILDHIRKELAEIEAEPGDVTEWADLVLLAFDGAWRSGHAPADTIAAIKVKQARNEARTWPDWRTADPNKAIEHVRALDLDADR